MKKVIRYSVLLCILLITSLFSCYSPKYAYRVLVWQESDYSDGEKFKYSEIKRGNKIFNFYKSDTLQTNKELQRLEAYVENNDFLDFLDQRGTYSFLVIRNDSILIEKYFNNNSRETLQNTFSVSKSILALAVAKAIELEFIKSIDEPITTYIPELIDRDANFKNITIGDLLRMRSGIKYSSKTSFPWLNRDNPMTYYHPNLRKVAINKTKIDQSPNIDFVYNNYNPLLIGLIMERATKTKLTTFIEEHLWTKIGTEYNARWSTDEQGFEKMESGFMASPIDLAKIGRLMLYHGKFNRDQILPPVILADFTNTLITIKVFEDREWGYGHFWWTLPDGTLNPSIMANGHMGQFIFINPKTNYIIIRNGLKVGKYYDDDWTELFQKYTKD